MSAALIQIPSGVSGPAVRSGSDEPHTWQAVPVPSGRAMSGNGDRKSGTEHSILASGRIHDLIARPTFPSRVTVSDDSAGRPHSRRSRGALVVRRTASDAPIVGVPPKDLAAPVPAGAALSSGRLFYQHSRLRRQAQGGCVLTYAHLSFTLKHFDQSSVQSVSHGGLIRCCQMLGAVAR